MTNNFVKTVFLLTVLLIPFSAFSYPFSEVIHNDWFFMGDFHTYDYASMIDLEHTWIENTNGIPGQLDWTHSLPYDVGIPPYNVTRAKLWIDAAYINADNKIVEFSGLMEWDVLNNRWFDNSTYDLGGMAKPDFWDIGGIDVAIFANEFSLRVDRAIMMMDYSSVSIPEPATMILVGLGLVGIGLQSRRRKK